MLEITQVLERSELADPTAAEKLLPLVYDELRRIAAGKLARERPGQTLQATALVHEAYVKLVASKGTISFVNRQHFFRAAAEAMRRILVDRARSKRSVRHGGRWQRLQTLSDQPGPIDGGEQTIVVHDLIDILAKTNPRQAEVAKLHLFLRLSFVEIAEILGVSPDTSESDWAYARAWLKREWGDTDAN